MAITDLFDRLTRLHDQLQAVADLSPGKGYDPIGFALCKLVYEDCTADQQKDFLHHLKANAPAMLADFQRASILSEVEMEKSVIDRIDPAGVAPLELDPDQNPIRQKIDKFNEIISAYPFSWGMSRAEEQLDLLKSRAPDGYDGFVIFGRSVLPMSGLSLHLLSDKPVIWVDPFESTRAYGNRITDVLADKQVISADGVTIISPREFDKMPALGNRWIGLVIDKDYPQADAYRALHAHGVESLMATEVNGLAELLYPRFKLDDATGYGLKAALVPPHVKYHDYDPALVTPGKKDDVFVTTLLLGPR